MYISQCGHLSKISQISFSLFEMEAVIRGAHGIDQLIILQEEINSLKLKNLDRELDEVNGKIKKILKTYKDLPLGNFDRYILLRARDWALTNCVL